MADAKLTITTNAKQVVEELNQVSEGLKNIDKNQKYIIDNADQISKQYGKTAGSIRETQKASQDLTNNAEKGLRREKGLIEDIETEIKKWQEAARKAWTTEDITKFNKKVEEAKVELKGLNELGAKTEKTTQSLSQSIGKWALGLGGAAFAIKKLTEAFKETVQGMNLFNQVGIITKTILNDIVSTGTISILHIRNAIDAQRMLNELRVEESFDLVQIAKANNEYQQEYAKSINQTLSKVDQLEAADRALAAHTKAIDIQVEHVKKALVAQKKLVLDSPTNEKYIIEYNKLRAELENLDAQRVATTKRLISRSTGIWKEMFDDVNSGVKSMYAAITQWEQESEDERLAQQKKYQEMALKLLDDYDKSQIDSLEGKEKLEAQRKFGIAQLKEFRDQLAKLGPVTEEQKKMLQTMADNIWKEYYKALGDESKDIRPTSEQQEAISKALIGDIPALQGLIVKDVEKARQGIEDDLTGNEAMQPFSIWKLLGIDPDTEEGGKQKEAIENMVSTITNTLDEIFDRRVEDTQRTRELLDTQIAESQRSLELEMDLMEEGYANNVEAKQKELETLKKQRAQALKDEEAAIKKQKALETVMQTSALITASAQTFKAFPGPLLPFAIATVAAMFAAFIASKVKASAAAKLAEGGSGSETGIITGNRHFQGGERFLDHVEVERGETWGVLSRPASEKYGKVFHEMVSSFNKDQMPNFMPVTNQVRVENSGPNSRLDKVITEQKKLNESILKQSQISLSGNKKIIKSGNKIRIVG